MRTIFPLFVGTILAVAVIALAVTTLIVTQGDDVGAAESRTDTGGLSYTMLELQGMTCIYVEYEGYHAGFAGLTCNWEEYQR